MEHVSTSMIFIAPVPAELRGRLLAYSRLYAYPVEPEPPPDDGFTILDSGAYGLARRGGEATSPVMVNAWLRGLERHYRQFAGERVICVAPDVYLDPAATIRNWRKWHDGGGPPVAPVIQFPSARRLDVYSAVKQARFYAAWSPPVVFISNPGLRAVECRDVMPALCRMVREASGAPWLHNLGAGWDAADVRAWRALGCFDSIDSIAYYTDARDGRAWGGRPAADWRETAEVNLRAANGGDHVRPTLL